MPSASEDADDPDRRPLLRLGGKRSYEPAMANDCKASDGRNPPSRHLKLAVCMRVVYAAAADTGHNNWRELGRLCEVVIATWLSAVQLFN
jgi:hypothetical protein